MLSTVPARLLELPKSGNFTQLQNTNFIQVIFAYTKSSTNQLQKTYFIQVGIMNADVKACSLKFKSKSGIVKAGVKACYLK